jgi:Subtilase family/Ca-dependent carbohydrate-binding module xylan-binding/Calx-beta domain/Lysyl oxidase
MSRLTHFRKRRIKRKLVGANRKRIAFENLESRHLMASIQLFAAGVTNQESIQLLIDDVPVATWNNLGGNAYAGQFVTLSHNTSGSLSPSQVRVAFLNDLYDVANGIDRNVRVDAIAIDDVRYETEAPDVFSTGTWKPEDGITPGYRQSEMLHTNGYFQYADTATNGSLIEIRARGDEGGEQAQLRIDGAAVFSFTTTTALSTYAFRAPATVTPDQIQVVFTNDLYDTAASIDRNLVVDYMAIDGVRFETEAISVFSTGTWRPEDGITPGFRQSEVLHANGYFHYGQNLAPGIISLTLDELTVDEDQGQLNFVVFRTGGADGEVQVDYATAFGTANGSDFTSTSGTLVFGDGITSRVVSIQILDDNVTEGLESFSFTISNPSGGAALGAITTQSVQIADNDQVFQGVVFSDGFEGASTWTRNPNSTDTATAGFWETGAPQQTSSSGTLQFGGGRNSPRALATGLAAGGTVNSYDVDGGVTSVWSPPITLPNGPDIELRFYYNFAHLNNASNSDFFKLSVVADGATNNVFTPLGQSTNRYAQWRSVQVNLTPFAGQTIRLLAEAADNGSSSLIEAALDDVTITSFANSPGVFAIENSSINVDESAGQVTVNVVRNVGRQGTASVSYRTLTGSASSSDFSARTGTLSFAAGEVSKSVSIPITNDTIQEQLETFQFEIFNPTGGAQLGTPNTASITIVDNDNTSQDFLPDLIPIPETMLDRLSIDTNRMPGRKLLRFSTEAANVGRGPLEIWGGAINGTSQQVFQRVYQPNNTSRDRLAGDFVYHPEHGHIHFEGFATYVLRTMSGGENVIASGGKTSFCLLNIRQPFPEITSAADRVNGRGGGSCGQIQGISTGYSDVYEADLEGQWIDITGIANGTYWLEMTVDPAGNIQEISEANNTTRVQVTIQNGSVSAGVAESGAPISNTFETYSSTGQGTVVALIDSGVDLNNTSIASRLWKNTLEIEGDGIDNDGNGFVDDVHGFDFVESDADVADALGHGTFVAGLLASEEGIAKDSRLMILRALDGSGQGSDEAISRSIRYAVDHGAHVIGLPLKGGASLEVYEAIQHAANNNVLIVAASGNGGERTPSYIAALSSQFKNVLSVGGAMIDGTRLPESNQVGRSGAVQIDAAGIARSTILDGQYETFRGTSVATGIATGAAALALSANPLLTASQLRDVLVSSASVVGPESDSVGLLDIAEAINHASWSSAIRIEETEASIHVYTSSSDDDIRESLAGFEINGINFPVPRDSRTVTIEDAGGTDRVRLTGSIGNDTAEIATDMAVLQTPQRTILSNGFEYVDVDGTGGMDTLVVRDSEQNDVFDFGLGRATMNASGVFRGGRSFEQVSFYGGNGIDTASVFGTAGNDSVLADGTLVTAVMGDWSVQVRDTENVNVELFAGYDQVQYIGGANNDTLTLRPAFSRFINSGLDMVVKGAENVVASAGQGVDSVSLFGGAGIDVVHTQASIVNLSGQGYTLRSSGFDTTRIASGGGADQITMRGSAGNDLLVSSPGVTTLSASDYRVIANGFPRVVVLGSGGVDTARITGTAGSDSVSFAPGRVTLVNAQYRIDVRDFAINQLFGGGGDDLANLVDGATNDSLSVFKNRVSLVAGTSRVTVDNFRRVTARSLVDSGRDTIRRYDSELDFVFEKIGDWIEI